jgi:hypothetical protein
MGHYASELGLMDDRPERPEERDSLSGFAEHLSSPDDDDNAGYHHYVIRTLINEVKERDKWWSPEAVTAELNEELRRRNALEAEVKELREENAGLERTIGQDRDAWGRAEVRIKQMEEALREKDEEIRHHMSQYMIMGDDDGG